MGKKAFQLGCGSVILAIISIIALVGWAISALNPATMQTLRYPVPDNVPPLPGVTVPDINVHTAGRTADKLKFWSDELVEKTGIPGQALRAYGNATLIAKDAWPNCHLEWTTLAGIGWVETRHGSYSGNWFDRSELLADGTTKPQIIGPALDGTPGFAEIPDTDGGVLDGDTIFDRAVGPMQFIPGSWAIFGRDADGDGIANPHQIDDAALGAAALLCAGGRDLGTAEGWTAAIYSYNHSRDYLIKVRDAANSYGLGQGN
ncbi:hypothetical protein [Corynebacterium caspium]|uniref:hypothetical protein n=1 Tax=Corynebacterium caspium TaxID=234828 RepID=UPI0003605452|nr:hypothetical protein [Corynebacterium caspium]WKD59572.1 hypothetical protein CCASP_05930 [Corynebacterium caspium DSM 44850]